MSQYITPGTAFPNYYQFPEFLLRAPISQTAKLAYMILYDRARLSKKNDWVAGGKVYSVYPIREMAETLGRSESTVKSAFNELRSHGLLISKDGGFSKANYLYVLVPDIGQISNWMEKKSVVRTENDTHSGQLSAPTAVGIPAPIKVKETNNMNQHNGVIQRVPFGRYENIYLSQAEYDRLKRDFPYRADSLIEEMSAYCEANGKKYQNYDAALRSWAAKEKQKPNSGFEDYSFEKGQSY